MTVVHRTHRVLTRKGWGRRAARTCASAKVPREVRVGWSKLQKKNDN